MARSLSLQILPAGTMVVRYLQKNDKPLVAYRDTATGLNVAKVGV